MTETNNEVLKKGKKKKPILIVSEIIWEEQDCLPLKMSWQKILSENINCLIFRNLLFAYTFWKLDLSRKSFDNPRKWGPS